MLKQNGHVFIPLEFESLSAEEQLARAHEFESRMRIRRTVRQFSSRAVPRELIEVALRVASRAPSGANQQPWRFVAVSAPEIKRKIRLAAETKRNRTMNGDSLKSGRMHWPFWRRTGTKSFWKLLRG